MATVAMNMTPRKHLPAWLARVLRRTSRPAGPPPDWQAICEQTARVRAGEEEALDELARILQRKAA